MFNKEFKQNSFIGKSNAFSVETDGNKNIVVESVMKDTDKLNPLKLLLSFDNIHKVLRTDFDVNVKILKSSDYKSCTKTFKKDGVIEGKWYNKCDVLFKKTYHVNQMGSKVLGK